MEKNIAATKDKKNKKDKNTTLYVYISVLTIAASILMVYLFNTYTISDYVLLVVFSVLSAIAETFLILLPKVGAVSVSFALGFSAILLTNPLTAAIINAVGIALRFPYVDGKGRVHLFNSPIYKTLFNISQYAINAGISGMVYNFVDSIINTGFEFYNPVAGAAALVIYILLNTFFMSELMSILLKEKLSYIWNNNFFSMMINVVLVGLLGIVLAFSYNSYGIGGLLLFFIPLLLARYTFKLYIDMRKNYFDTMNVLVRAIEASDPYTSGHSLRVSSYSEIGKIGIDKNILNKTERLKDEEFETIKSHTEIGATIVADLSYLANISDIIRHHHERNDGKGYPDGLSHNSIPLETSILTIADSFDAMTTNRPYRHALSLEDALGEMKKNAGTQFNPDIIDNSIIALRNTYYNISE